MDQRRYDALRMLTRRCWIIFIAMLAAVGCKRSPQPPAARMVTLYTSVDEPYVRPLIAAFEQRHGIEVSLLTDAEASKSVGLAERLRAEKDQPRADVWWDNELLLTLRLAEAGVLEPYASPAGQDLPDESKDPQHRWAAAALRARVLIVNPNYAGPPLSSIEDLTRPELRGKVAMALPTAGTTGGHVAALYTLWPKETADAFFQRLADNEVALLGGNAVVADAVGRGDFVAGLCDNDDASAASESSAVQMILPDQQPNGIGTLAVPCPVSLIARAPHSQAGRELIDYLLSPAVADQLVQAHFAFCTARNARQIRWMAVDSRRAADTFPAAVHSALTIMQKRR